jgi:anti-sigma B factor antagonist
VDLKLGHYSKDGIEVVDVEGEIDIYSAPRLRELLIDLVSTNNYQLIVDLDKVGFLDSTGLGVLVPRPGRSARPGWRPAATASRR